MASIDIAEQPQIDTKPIEINCNHTNASGDGMHMACEQLQRGKETEVKCVVTMKK